MSKIKICVIGTGEWGLNHIKTLLDLNISVGCIDLNQNKLKNAKFLFPNITSLPSIEESLNLNYNGYIIASPPSTHCELAKLIISNKKPVLVEKPLSLSVKESEEIKLYIDKFDGKLIVGHLLLFHPAIEKIKAMIIEGRIGKIQYIYSNRLNLGTVRSHENVFWSFAPHDISLFQYFTNSFPLEVFSVGGDLLQKKIHDTTITYLKYPNKIQGHIYVSWLHPFKEHRLVIIGSKGSIHFEDSIKNKPLLFYEKDISKDNNLYLKNKTPIKIEYKFEMPLKNELIYFIDIINGGSIKKASINEGIDVIKILESASKSLNFNS
tara:strand:- start:136 stop:1101 length:966 start_codon:yes stop_codon:yes gene_type:complete